MCVTFKYYLGASDSEVKKGERICFKEFMQVSAMCMKGGRLHK